MEYRYGVDVCRAPEVLDPFDRVVVATGACYRYGLGALVPRLLAAGRSKSALTRRLFASQGLRDWFYYRARRGRGAEIARLVHPGQKLLVIGDAARAGKGREAIEHAVRAAQFDPLTGAAVATQSRAHS